MSGCLYHHLGAAAGDLLPAFLADHDVQLERLLPPRERIRIIIVNVLDPLEFLASISPLVIESILALETFEPVDFLPDLGQRIVLQDDHEIPVVLAAELDDRSVGVESMLSTH